MRLIDRILSDKNIKEAMEKVKSNKGTPGIDKMTVKEIDEYFKEHKGEIKEAIIEMKYKPQPVRRVYIPKSNGNKRPLGIPNVVDRVIQQAIAQEISKNYEPIFSEHSQGFRVNRSCHKAVEEAIDNLNEGYEWVIELDIEKYFDTVNYDKLISILREQVNDKITLNLIRKFLRAGIMENGLVSASKEGVPQGGPLSPILSNIYLDKFDKELESRGLRFVRYADDSNIFVRSEMSADRVMKSVTKWLEKKLFLKASASKTKIVRPTKSDYLGFTFWKNSKRWQCKPAKDRKAKLYKKAKEILNRKKAVSKPLGITIREINQLVIGWINYYKIGSMKVFLKTFGEWIRHKIRVIIIKQWKIPKRIYTNLQILNRIVNAKMTDEEIYKVANSRLGWYRRSGMYAVNYLLNPKILAKKTKERPGGSILWSTT